MGAAVAWGLVTRAWSGWRRVLGIAGHSASRVRRLRRCAMVIAAGRVAWVAPCH